MESLRTFIALDIKPTNKLLDDWNELKELLKSDKIKWVDNKTLHLTLFFLGETPEKKIESISQNLSQALSTSKSFKLTIKGFGSFGNPLSPRVIWVGVEKSKDLVDIKEKVNSVVIPLGYNEEFKEFSPHITLGRVKEIKPSGDIKKFIQEKREVIYQTIIINEVILYQSVLRPEGPVYKPIKTFKLLSL